MLAGVNGMAERRRLSALLDVRARYADASHCYKAPVTLLEEMALRLRQDAAASPLRCRCHIRHTHCRHYARPHTYTIATGLHADTPAVTILYTLRRQRCHARPCRCHCGRGNTLRYAMNDIIRHECRTSPITQQDESYNTTLAAVATHAIR